MVNTQSTNINFFGPLIFFQEYSDEIKYPLDLEPLVLKT